MEILDTIINELKEAFQYSKERSEDKYCGDRFEEWVVKNSNVSKNGSVGSGRYKTFWKLLEWRGDKYVDGYRPQSSSSPDLLFECVCDSSANYKKGEVIAVECKWRHQKSFYLDKKNIMAYEKYVCGDILKFPIEKLFYVFGFGWSSDRPEVVYVVPSNELYDYDKESGQLKFPEESVDEKMARLERCKVDNKWILYPNESRLKIHRLTINKTF